MMKKRILALCLALVVSVGLLGSPVSAASVPQLEFSPVEEGGQTVRLTDLPGDCYGVQVTLTLDSAKETSFTFDPSIEGMGSYCTYKQNDTNVTLYVTSKTALNQGDSLSLGTLSVNGAEVKSASGLKLLNVSAPLYENEGVSWSAESGKENDTGNNTGNGSESGGQTGDDGGRGDNTGNQYVPSGKDDSDQDDPEYSITVRSGIRHGAVTASRQRASYGESVTITVTPDEGYQLEELTATNARGGKLALSGGKNGKYTFQMPSSQVEIAASFAAQPSVPDSTPPDSTPPVKLPFVDVAPDAWYYDAVDFVYQNGLMNGTDSAVFSPDTTTTRGMIVTILYRFDGTSAAGTSDFTDVPAGQYYTAPVAWAAANGIVTGYGDGRFGPNDTITRQQMAAILYRYAQYRGYDVTARADLSAYQDAGQIDSYAADAMSWANAEGLINGIDAVTLAPGGFATRAQVATILMRFCG